MNYKEDKFKLVSNIKKFILDTENLTANIPRSDYYNRDKFKNDITEVLYLVHLGNNTTDISEKKHYQVQVIAKLSVIDFYLERAYVLKYINEKQLYNYTNKLEVLIKMTKGWMKLNE